MQPYGLCQSAAPLCTNHQEHSIEHQSHKTELTEPVYEDSIKFIKVLDPDDDFNTSFDVSQTHPMHNSEGAPPPKLGLPFAITLLHWWQFQIS